MVTKPPPPSSFPNWNQIRKGYGIDREHPLAHTQSLWTKGLGSRTNAGKPHITATPHFSLSRSADPAWYCVADPANTDAEDPPQWVNSGEYEAARYRVEEDALKEKTFSRDTT